MTRRLRGLGVLVVLTLAGCGGGVPLLGGDMPEAVEEEYQIHANDQLEISVWGHQDLTRSLPVREDGTFAFPFVGEVLARGRTVREIEQILKEGLENGYLRKPLVSIKLVGPRFSILGEVERPGSYPLDGRIDLLAGISMAGGLSKFGSSHVEVIRVRADGQKVSFHMDMNAVLSGRRPTILVHPYDTIHVRRRLI